jgi:hypothetical protein
MRASLRRGTSITSIADYRELPSLSRVAIVCVVAICGADTFASPITIESDHRSDSPLVLVSCSSRGEASPSDAPPFLFLPLFLFPPPSAEPKEDSSGLD